MSAPLSYWKKKEENSKTIDIATLKIINVDKTIPTC